MGIFKRRHFLEFFLYIYMGCALLRMVFMSFFVDFLVEPTLNHTNHGRSGGSKDLNLIDLLVYKISSS